MVKSKIRKYFEVRLKGMENTFCSLQEMSNLLKFICFLPFSFLSCIYRASVDGYQASDFHRKCDSKKNLLVLIKANNFVFGK